MLWSVLSVHCYWLVSTFHHTTFIEGEIWGQKIMTNQELCSKIETPYHDNDLILTPIISPLGRANTNNRITSAYLCAWEIMPLFIHNTLCCLISFECSLFTRGDRSFFFFVCSLPRKPKLCSSSCREFSRTQHSSISVASK